MSKKTTEDITNLLRARNAFLWITTKEEKRVETQLTQAAASAKYRTRYWDCATGLSDETGKAINDRLRDPNAVIELIRTDKTRCVYILRDLHAWMNPVTTRNLKSLIRLIQGDAPTEARAVIVITPSSDIPPDLVGSVTVVDYPLPDRDEMAALLDASVARLETQPEIHAQVKASLSGEMRDKAIDAVVGLTAEEASSCFAKSLVTLRRIDPVSVSAEKKRVIDRSKLVEWFEPDPRGFGAIGGLDILKPWATQKKLAFSPEAKAYGLPAPKGVFLAGISGCGKSAFVKALASAFGQVLLRLDLGAQKSKFVGESEQNIRAALKLAETVQPCVLWVDEVDKALAGSTGQQGDGGVSSDALGTLLTWMQEKTANVFVAMTANDVRGLPPELLRKGRFDEVFWVDLPTYSERIDVLRVTLEKMKQDTTSIALSEIALATKAFTGAEIAALVPEAMFVAFADGARPITTADLLNVAKSVVPLSTTGAEKIEDLRKWAKTRARPASTPEDSAAMSLTAGALDIS